jgi:hypothetical protein
MGASCEVAGGGRSGPIRDQAGRERGGGARRLLGGSSSGLPIVAPRIPAGEAGPPLTPRRPPRGTRRHPWASLATASAPRETGGGGGTTTTTITTARSLSAAAPPELWVSWCRAVRGAGAPPRTTAPARQVHRRRERRAGPGKKPLPDERRGAAEQRHPQVVRHRHHSAPHPPRRQLGHGGGQGAAAGGDQQGEAHLAHDDTACLPSGHERHQRVGQEHRTPRPALVAGSPGRSAPAASEATSDNAIARC